jgi:hypothetical protein
MRIFLSLGLHEKEKPPSLKERTSRNVDPAPVQLTKINVDPYGSGSRSTTILQSKKKDLKRCSMAR